MELTPAEGRVLACLIEKQVDSPDAYSLTLDELRFACNQTTGRQEEVTYDDRVVTENLLSLKSKGLARFVPTGRGTGDVRYRHRADERWRLNVQELAVLASLILRGPQTPDRVLSSVPAGSLLETPAEVEAVLDGLAGRTPTGFAMRLHAKSRGREVRWAEILTGRPEDVEQLELSDMGDDRPPDEREEPLGRPSPYAAPTGAGAAPSPLTMVELADRLSSIERRLAGIESDLAILRQIAENQGAQDRPGSRLGTR